MKLTVRLFIQKHDNRVYTVSVPAFPGVASYGPTLEECKQEVAEALMKRLAEMPAESLQLVEFKPNQSLEKVAVELRPTDRHGRRRRDSLRLTISLLLTPEDSGQILVSAPRLRYPPLSFYVANAAELNPIAQLELAQYFHGESFETLQQLQAARHEYLDTLEVEFKPKKTVEADDEREEEGFWALKQSGVNLTAQAAEGQLRRAFRREREVEALLAGLSGDRRPSMLLIGASGVGKTAIMHEVARRIRRKECPEALHDRQVWSVTAASLLAGCMFLGQWQEKLNDLVREVRKKRHILFVEDLAALSESGRHSKSDDNMADFLKPYIQSGDVVLIGETTPERLRRAEQLVPGFVAQFRTLEIAPTGESDTLSILTATARELERAEELRIEPSALEAAVELTNRFQPYRMQPGKSVSLIEQVASETARQRSSGTNAPRPALTRREVVQSFARQSGLPEFIITDHAPLDLAAVRAHFADRIIGQDAAVDAMTDLIAMVKAGLNDPEKPLGTFLFIGPTGVGKTQLAKTLAKYLFGDERRMLRFDMSEYSDPTGGRRLIGMPGSGEAGELTGQVRRQPFCVVLLDEFEKADALIYDMFLQVFGEGRLTDASGQTTSFQNAIIILTSNLGAGAREQRGIGLGAVRTPHETDRPEADGVADGQAYWQRKVEEYFRPEFVNRLDQIVAFRPLHEAAMRQIARRELGEILLREGFVRRNVLVEIDEQVIDLLLDAGFNPTYGARPLKRAVERLVVLPLARYLAARGRPGVDLLRLTRDGHQVALATVQLAGSELVGSDTGATPLHGMASRRRRLDDRGLSEAFAELRRRLDDWDAQDSVAEMRNERTTLLAETNKPTFWDDGDAARAMLARFYTLDRLLRRLQQLSDRVVYLEELSGLVHRQRDPRYRADLANSYDLLERDVAFLEVELLCAHLTEAHRAILCLRRVGMPQKSDGDAPWMPQLAAMYVRWAARKGYDIECFALEPLADHERRHGGLLGQFYPFKWVQLESSDIDAFVRTIQNRGDLGELAIALEGTNVFGFLKGEIGVHRRSDKRASGERVQRLAEVLLLAPGDLTPRAGLEHDLLSRAMAEQARAAQTKKQRAAQPKPPEPDVIRVYQFEGERSVRDLRTRVRVHEPQAVLDGNLDDFILAYLREEEAAEAWNDTP